MKDLWPLAAVPVMIGCCAGLPLLAGSGIGLAGALAWGFPLIVALGVAVSAGVALRVLYLNKPNPRKETR